MEGTRVMVTLPPAFVLKLPRAEQERVAYLYTELTKLARPYHLIYRWLTVVAVVLAGMAINLLISSMTYTGIVLAILSYGLYLFRPTLAGEGVRKKIAVLLKSDRDYAFFYQLKKECPQFAILPTPFRLSESEW